MKQILLTALRVTAAIIVILLPFWPITENFFPPEAQVNNQSFFTYLMLGITIVLAGLGLMFALKRSNSFAGWLFFAIGMVALFPLHLGPPREDARLLTFSAIEKFRYGMLLVAVSLLFFSALKINTGLKKPVVIVFIVFLSVTAVLNIWDNFSSFLFSSQMQQWVNSGNPAGDFFKQFDYHEVWRGIARISLYLSAVFIAFLLFRKAMINKWQMLTLTLFSLTGIVFCLVFIAAGPVYYFPFMVPAIALAPAYWTGIAMIVNKTTRQNTTI